jgi:hypothetical protein
VYGWRRVLLQSIYSVIFEENAKENYKRLKRRRTCATVQSSFVAIIYGGFFFLYLISCLCLWFCHEMNVLSSSYLKICQKTAIEIFSKTSLGQISTKPQFKMAWFSLINLRGCFIWIFSCVVLSWPPIWEVGSHINFLIIWVATSYESESELIYMSYRSSSF